MLSHVLWFKYKIFFGIFDFLVSHTGSCPSSQCYSVFRLLIFRLRRKLIWSVFFFLECPVVPVITHNVLPASLCLLFFLFSFRRCTGTQLFFVFYCSQISSLVQENQQIKWTSFLDVFWRNSSKFCVHHWRLLTCMSGIFQQKQIQTICKHQHSEEADIEVGCGREN